MPQDTGFNFLDGTATGGNQPKAEPKKVSDAIVAYGMTAAQIKEAKELAESPEGLNIEAFTKKHRLVDFNVEAVLAYKFAKPAAPKAKEK